MSGDSFHWKFGFSRIKEEKILAVRNNSNYEHIWFCVKMCGLWQILKFVNQVYPHFFFL
jgi:hypothetical protein